MKLFAPILIITLAISTLASADAPVLTIDSVEGTQAILTINYTVVDLSDVEFVTSGWQFSKDGGANWLDIDAVAIGNNAPKPAGSSFITWDTQAGANNLGDKSYGRIYFRMFVKDPLGNTWKTKSPMPTARSYLAAAEVNGKLYAVGGWAQLPRETTFNTVEEYDPASNRWRQVAPMPTARRRLAAAVVDGKIYAIGGYDDRNVLNVAEEYNPSTNTWRQVAPRLVMRSSFAAAVVNGKIYAVGASNIVEEYNPASNRWRQLAPMPTGRGNLAAAVVNGKIYAVGGNFWDGSKYIYLNTLEEYTPPRESEIVTSDSFAVGDQAVIASPEDGAFLSGVVNVMGTAMVAEGKLNSWILDFARGEHPDAGYTPITISSEPVEDGLLGEWDTTAHDDGIYTLRLRVTDTDAVTLETAIVVTLDNTPPDAPTVQINSSSGFEFIKSNATITISGSAEGHATLENATLID